MKRCSAFLLTAWRRLKLKLLAGVGLPYEFHRQWYKKPYVLDELARAGSLFPNIM